MRVTAFPTPKCIKSKIQCSRTKMCLSGLFAVKPQDFQSTGGRLSVAHITVGVEERTLVLLLHSDVMGQLVRVFTLLKRGRTNSPF